MCRRLQASSDCAPVARATPVDATLPHGAEAAQAVDLFVGIAVVAQHLGRVLSERGCGDGCGAGRGAQLHRLGHPPRSEEHTSELQSLMRISYAVFCLTKKTQT